MNILEMDDTKLDVVTLSYATRLIFSELNTDLIVKRSLDSIAGVTGGARLALMLLDPEDYMLHLAGVLSPEGYAEPNRTFSLEGTPVSDVVFSKMITCFSLTHRQGIPWPGAARIDSGERCLCAPLVASNNRVVGVVNVELPQCFSVNDIQSMELRILLTVVAVALETARLFRTAVFDSLTGLHIRRYFEHRLTEEEARIKRYGGRVSLLLLDVDHFKNINDSYGHQQGDSILEDIARIMRESCRQGVDLVSRYGGEEFVIMIPETEAGGAVELAQRIRRKVDIRRFPGPDVPLRVTLSIGVSWMDQDCFIGGHELFKRADQALYKAKKQGRNRVEIWEEA